jgi:hypothetical protein
MYSDCEGSWNAAQRKKERMAVRRTLRLLALLPRCFSRSSRNAQTNGASISESSKLEGGLCRCFCAKFGSKRKVSGSDSVWAGLPLSHQALGEEALQQCGEVGRSFHGRASQRFSSRRGGHLRRGDDHHLRSEAPLSTW